MTQAPDDGLLKLADYVEKQWPQFLTLSEAETIAKVLRASAQRSGVGEPVAWQEDLRVLIQSAKDRRYSSEAIGMAFRSRLDGLETALRDYSRLRVHVDLSAASESVASLYEQGVSRSEVQSDGAWSASTHDEIIKRLMAGVGMPNSTSLYTAFKQLANELHALAHSRSASAAQEASKCGEPSLWICFADNGNIRAWTRDHNRKELFRLDGLDMQPFYAPERGSDHG